MTHNLSPLSLLVLVFLSACDGNNPVDPGSVPVPSVAAQDTFETPPAATADCRAATAELTVAYSDVRACSTNEDCAYVSGVYPNGSFEVAALEDGVATIWRDCTQAPIGFVPIIVANPNLVDRQAPHLARLVELQQLACNSDETERCQAFVPQSFRQPPRCSDEGVCVAP